MTIIEEVRRIRDGYASQAQFADHEAAAYFREFVRRLDAALGAPTASPSIGPSKAPDEPSSSAQSQPGCDGERAASDTLSLLGRDAAEKLCRDLWGERQDACAQHGADIPMPRVEVRVDELADLLRGSAEALTTIEGLGRLGELVTAFVDPSGVLNVAGLKDRILALEQGRDERLPPPFCMLGAAHCTCGGDTPRVRATCPNWSRRA